MWQTYHLHATFVHIKCMKQNFEGKILQILILSNLMKIYKNIFSQIKQLSLFNV